MEIKIEKEMDQQQREKIEKRGERFMMMNSATSADEKSLLGEVQRQRGQNVQLKKSIGDLQLKIDEYQKSRRELQVSQIPQISQLTI